MTITNLRALYHRIGENLICQGCHATHKELQGSTEICSGPAITYTTKRIECEQGHQLTRNNEKRDNKPMHCGICEQRKAPCTPDSVAI